MQLLSLVYPVVADSIWAVEQLPVNWNIRVEKKAYRRRLLIQIKPCGEIVVSTLMGTSQKQIDRFLLENHSWIDRQLLITASIRQHNPKILFESGDKIPVLGQYYELLLSEKPKIQFEILDEKIHLGLPGSFWQLSEIKRFKYKKKLFQSFFKKRAERFMRPRVQEWSEKMNLHPSRVVFRGQKSMWGSCSYRGVISLNWKLMTFPRTVVDYVIIHELAHLRYRNHSAEFWNLVSEFDEKCKSHRRLLRDSQFGVDFLSNKSELYPELNVM